MVAVDLSGQPFIALLGRDFLAKKLLTYNGASGEYTISW